MRSVLHTSALAAMAWLTVSLSATTAAAPDRYLPDDADVALTVNLHALFASAPAGHQLDALRDALKAAGDAQSELDAIGLDPFTDLDSITIAGEVSQGSERVVLIVHGHFDFDKIRDRLQEYMKEHAEACTAVKEGEYEFIGWTPPGKDQPAYVGWPDSETIVVSPVKELLVHSFDVQAGKAKPALNQGLADLLEHSEDGDVIWVAALGSSLRDVPEAAAIRSISGGLAIDAGLHVRVAVSVKDADSADRLAKAAREQLVQVKRMVTMIGRSQEELAPLLGLFDDVTIAAEGDTVKVKADVTEEQLKKSASSQAARRPAKRSHRSR